MKIRPLTRKESLEYRAHCYSQRFDESTACFGQRNGALGFSDGYRAAMRDMRKVVRQCSEENKWHPVHQAVQRLQHINHCVRVRVQQFLRPLR